MLYKQSLSQSTCNSETKQPQGRKDYLHFTERNPHYREAKWPAQDHSGTCALHTRPSCMPCFHEIIQLVTITWTYIIQYLVILIMSFGEKVIMYRNFSIRIYSDCCCCCYYHYHHYLSICVCVCVCAGVPQRIVEGALCSGVCWWNCGVSILYLLGFSFWREWLSHIWACILLAQWEELCVCLGVCPQQMEGLTLYVGCVCSLLG